MIEIYELNKIEKEKLRKILKRANMDIENVKEDTINIINKVKIEGDKALVEFTRKWDNPNFNESDLIVTKENIKEAYEKTSKKAIEMIRKQIKYSKIFAEKQRENIIDWKTDLSKKQDKSIIAGEKWTPIDEVGLYIPGGKNPFPTVQQILAVPAKIAGCKRIVSCISPSEKNYEVIIAAVECGVNEIYRVSGAQAIAAMTYGTKTIKPVSLIAGPGNPYVTAAKILSQDTIAIDMPAGPSEAIILADSFFPKGMNLKTKAKYCAADILARAEHGPDSAGLLVTDSMKLAELTRKEIAVQYETLSRQKYIKIALKEYSAIIVTEDMNAAIEFINNYAPEHLEVLTENQDDTLKKINNAGSIFLGYYNPVSVGDYASGVNHILPTGSWAKMTSAVNVRTFMKSQQFSYLEKKGLEEIIDVLKTISDIEGLDAHKKSATMRLGE